MQISRSTSTDRVAQPRDRHVQDGGFWSSPTPLRYLGKRAYVLVGPETYSAGEEFAYDLQALKRATVVGTKTRGGANPGGLTNSGSNFFVVVATGRAENPITHTNWEGVDVLPDIQAAPDVAESTAITLAKGRPRPAHTKKHGSVIRSCAGKEALPMQKRAATLGLHWYGKWRRSLGVRPPACRYENLRFQRRDRTCIPPRDSPPQPRTRIGHR